MARVSYGQFKVFNPTPFKIKTGFDMMSKTGAEYVFAPFEEKELFVKDHVDHICESKRTSGLVFLDYNDSARKVYPTYEDFKIAKSIEGITQALKRQEEALLYEQAAQSQAKQKEQVMELRTMSVENFQENINDLNGLLSKLKAPKKIEKKKVKAVAPEWMTGESTENKEWKVEKKPSGKYMIDKGEGMRWASKDDLKEMNIDISGDDNTL